MDDRWCHVLGPARYGPSVPQPKRLLPLTAALQSPAMPTLQRMVGHAPVAAQLVAALRDGILPHATQRCLASARLDRFFGRGGEGLLNSSDAFRIGWGWKGAANSGPEARLASAWSLA
jgi:hypothetical protein